MRNTKNGNRLGKDSGTNNDQPDSCIELHRPVKRLHQFLNGEITPQKGDQSSCRNADRGCLGGRRPAHDDASHDGKHQQQDRPDAQGIDDHFKRRYGHRFTRIQRRIAQTADQDIAHEHKGYHQTRNDAGDKQAANRGFRQGSEDQEGQAGGNKQPQGSSPRQGADDHIPIIAAAPHFRIGHRADRRGCRQARTAHCAEDGAHRDVGVQQATGNPGKDRGDSGVHPLAQATAQQDFTEQYKKRDRTQSKGIEGIPDGVEGQRGGAAGKKMEDKQPGEPKRRTQRRSRGGSCSKQ